MAIVHVNCTTCTNHSPKFPSCNISEEITTVPVIKIVVEITIVSKSYITHFFVNIVHCVYFENMFSKDN